MFRRRRDSGFSLMELLLVLAILGIISGIAVPVYMGQRRRARIIGDAISNSKVISMQMEQFKADSGTYGPAAATATWNGGNTPTLSGFTSNPCPGFAPGSNSKMNYVVTVGANRLTYTVDVSDPSLPSTPLVYRTDQAGTELYRMD